MTKKIIILLIIIAICAGLLYSLFVYTSFPTENVINQPESVLPLAPYVTSSRPTGKNIIISTPQGDVTVDNFFKFAAPVPYYDEVSLFKSGDYIINYYVPDKYFNIIIYKKPVMETKKIMEQKIIELLKTSPENICKLNISVGTVVSVDPDLAGKELGLSFCQ